MTTYARDIMDPNPTSICSTDVIGTAAKYIMKHRYRSLPVIDEQGCYLGVFGVNCLVRLILPHAAVMDEGLESLSFVHETLEDLHQRLREVLNEPVTICMKNKLKTVTPDTPLLQTLLVLYQQKASVPVVEENSCKLVGMISYWDVGHKILSA